MNYTINPLTSHQTGAEITGLDLTKPLSDDTRAALNRDFAKYHVLVFRDQKLSPEDLLNAGRIFGEPMRHDERPSILGRADMPVYELRNIQVAPGKYQIAGESYHTDHSNHQAPPKATFLHAVDLPSRGGDTQFVNMHLAYDDLPESMKQRLAPLKATHAYEGRYSPRKLREVPEEDKKRLPPPAVHPLICVHPENGRKFLFVCDTRIDSITGVSEAETPVLLRQLMTHGTRPNFEYRHKWRPGDALIWDNRSVLHQANGDYDMNETRRMYRIMLKGVPLAGATEN
jgi:taurine dioxygenase